MSLSQFCHVCLKTDINLKNLYTYDEDAVMFIDKFKSSVPEIEFKEDIPLFICNKCCQELRNIYKFKQLCIKNITILKKYSVQIKSVTESAKTIENQLNNILTNVQNEVQNYDEKNAEYSEQTSSEENNRNKNNLEEEFEENISISEHFMSETDESRQENFERVEIKQEHYYEDYQEDHYEDESYESEDQNATIEISKEEYQAPDENLKAPGEIHSAKNTADELLPTKSSSVYEAAYKRYINWCTKKNIYNHSENDLLLYFSEMVNILKMKCSTLWSHYSMVKSTINIKHGINIGNYSKLRAYLKKQNEGYTSKKARVLTKEQFYKFLVDAPDKKYLAMKVILILGISGACRCEELVKMKVEDFEDHGSLLYIKIPGSKTCKKRSFTVVGDMYLSLYRKYKSLRPARMNDSRFFLKYKNGVCYKMVMGIHKIGSVPKEVAAYLKLPNFTEFTGHSLRRTSATMHCGADISCLKCYSGSKSSTVVEGSIEES